MSFSNWGSGAFGSEPDNYNNQDGLALGLENWPAGSPDGAGYGNAGFWNDVDVNNELFFVMQTADIPPSTTPVEDEPTEPDSLPSAPQASLITANVESAPTGVDKVLVENYGYSWIEGKYYSSGTAPEIELEGDAIHTVTVSKVGNQNVFFIDGNSNPDFVIEAGKTYRFDQSDASNTNHPLNFLSEAGSDISSFVEVSGTAGMEGAYVDLRFEAGDIANIDGPELSYYCELHGAAMGNEIEIQNIIA